MKPTHENNKPSDEAQGQASLGSVTGSPSSIKLKTLLGKITPLPWRLDVITGHLLFSNSRNLKREEDGIVKARATYLTHAANVLPGLVDALNKIRLHVCSYKRLSQRDCIRDEYPESDWCEECKNRHIVSTAIKLAETVEMENDRTEARDL